MQNCFWSHLKSPSWGDHIKGNHNFSTLFKPLWFLNEVTIWAVVFLIFSKFINLQQLARILVTTILQLFMVALVQLIENVTKWALIFDHVPTKIYLNIKTTVVLQQLITDLQNIILSYFLPKKNNKKLKRTFATIYLHCSDETISLFHSNLSSLSYAKETLCRR